MKQEGASEGGQYAWNLGEKRGDEPTRDGFMTETALSSKGTEKSLKAFSGR